MTIRLRLFWHILGAFLLTLTLLGLVLAAVYKAPPLYERPIVGFVQSVMRMLEHSVEQSGPDAARQQLAIMPPQVASRIVIEPVDQMESVENAGLLKWATAPDGQVYKVEYVRPPPSLLDRLPSPTILGVLFAGLLFSVGWALHLSRPIRILSEGFSRLSAGDLDVKLNPAINRHSGEFAGLADDFSRMTDRLSQLVTARERLLHDVSHELRSPLTRLQLAISLGRQDPARAEASLDRIEHEAGKLEALVDELLTLAWAESSEVSKEDYFDPVEALSDIAEDARLEATEKGVRIDLGPLPGEDRQRPLMVGNASLLQRAVDNVLRNAIRHSPEDAAVEIDVELCESEPSYRISIRDHGPGVSPEMLRSVLEPFVHGDPQGTGLGLAIADRATRALGGELSLTNGEGGGLVAQFDFPAVALRL